MATLLRKLLKVVVLLAKFALAATVAQAQEINQIEIWLGSEMYGRYAELARSIEATERDLAKIPIERLAPLCLAYSRLKQYSRLFPCIDELEARVARNQAIAPPPMIFAGQSDFRPLSKMLAAEALLELGDYRKSIAEGEISLSRVQDQFINGAIPTIRYKSTILSNLALAAMFYGDRAAAQKYVQTLEQTPLNAVGGFALYSQMKEIALARAKMALGDCEGALADTSSGLMSAIGGFGALFLRSGSDSAENLLDIPRHLIRGKCQLQTNRIGEARKSLDLLLANRRTSEQGEIFWLALFERGKIAEAEKQPAEAVRYYARAVEAIEQQRATINTEASKIGFVGDKQSVYARVVSLLVQQGRAAEAFDYVERSKSRALVDMLASKKDFAAQELDSGKTRLMLAQLDSADLASRIKDDSVKTGENPGRRNLDLVRREIREAMPELATLVAVSAVPSDEMKALVGTDEALIEYYYQGDELFVFVLDRQNLQAVKLDATGLGEQVQAFRKTLEDPRASHWQVPARALHERLWRPIEPMLNATKAIVVAHGALHYLPFSVLQAADGALLIDRMSMRFLPSASVLKFLRPASANKDARLLVFGNPDLGDAKLDLQFAEGEARLIAGMSETSRLLVRLDASETNFKKAGAVFSRVHFATHGKFQADDPLSSGLYLAKDAENDGVLTVGELYSMNLDADLVTLSACETGLGKIANGDDVVGLTRGFLYAGSRSIVASLWSVDDKATATLMQAFYTNLAGMNKQEALRQAQIKARQDFPHPFYWAAFQLTGRAE